MKEHLCRCQLTTHQREITLAEEIKLPSGMTIPSHVIKETTGEWQCVMDDDSCDLCRMLHGRKFVTAEELLLINDVIEATHC